MTENVDIKGLWWLPSNPEHKVAGALHYEPMGKTNLDLIGEFRPNDWSRSFNETKEEEVIWGLSSDNKDITLLQNCPFATKNTSCPFPVMHYDCQFLIIGKHIQSLKEEGQYSARILFDELSFWYRPSILRSKYNEKEKEIAFISSLNNTSTDIQVTDNIKFSFEPQLNVSIEDTGLTTDLTQSTDLIISFTTPRCLQYILNVVKEFEQFLSVATLSHVQCKSFYIYDSSQGVEIGNKQKIEIMHHYFREEYKPNKKFFNYLFTYDSIKGQLPNVLQKWYATEDIMPIRSHLIDSLNRHGVFCSTDFLVVVQAIEGFYYRFRQDNNESLRTILEDLTKEFSDVKFVEFEDDDRDKIVDSRHYFTHLLPPEKKDHVVHGKELYNLDFKLRKLLLCCVLNFMGLENSTINSLVAKSNNHHLRMLNSQKNYVKEVEEPITLEGEVVSSVVETKIEEKGTIK
jgi:hypothetical protein